MTAPTPTPMSCPCGEGGTPDAQHVNRPGQSALDYRIGTHGSFLQRMLDRLAREEIPDGDNKGRRPLAALTTRSPADPAVALLNAWAVTADVLTFYQERMANEGFLRTATERRSVLELARAIGYELSPGVAASTFLAFTVDESDSTPDTAPIPAGTQVQSIPAKEGELPQTFETSEAFEAQAGWNVLRARKSTPQVINFDSRQLYLTGTNLNLSPGDRMLLVAKDEDGRLHARARQIRTVEVNQDAHHTRVTFEAFNDSDPISSVGAVATPHDASLEVQTYSSLYGTGFNAKNLEYLFDTTLSESQIRVLLKSKGWKAREVRDVRKKRVDPTSLSDFEIFVFREKAGIFGHNAPHYDMLSFNARNAIDIEHTFYEWDTAGWNVWKDTLKNTDNERKPYYEDADLYLERPVSGILKDSWLLLEPGPSANASEIPKTFRVHSATEGSLTGFGISAKTVGLELMSPDGGDPNKDAYFKVRKTTAYVKSEKLTPAVVPIEDDLQAGDSELTLDTLVLGLSEDQPVVLTGEQADAPGVTRREIKRLKSITHGGGWTTLGFTEGLRFSLKRSTVTLNANVVPATHGETVAREVLGGGDGAAMHQRFKLKKPPLTHVSAPTPSGGKSTLSVRIDGVRWQEVSTLYGLDESTRRYILRMNNEGETFVIFGDGKRGARLPTGRENVIATYRSGIGADGEVAADSLTLMKKRPFGIKGVTNPSAALGADNPETLEDARGNAPLRVLTLDRIVSLQDFEDFARAFTGIGKARAVALWNGQTEVVHITIADANGDPVPTQSNLFQNLRDAINAVRDPLRPIELSSFQELFFDLEARVLIDPAYAWESIRSQVTTALMSTFSFTRRHFGQPVTSAEILRVIHDVQGIVAVDLEKLYLLDEQAQQIGHVRRDVLPAQIARPNVKPSKSNPSLFLPAELLLINEAGLTLLEMTS